MTENEAREALATFGKSLYDRGYTHGSSGNLSVRLSDGLLVTPTNSCLGRLDPARISKIDFSGSHFWNLFEHNKLPWKSDVRQVLGHPS